MKRIILIGVCLFFVQTAVSYGQTLDGGLQNLAEQITGSLTEKSRQKIAVIEMSDLDGKITSLGKYLSEELITRLFLTKKYDVVERQMLNKVLEEHQFNVSGLVDTNTAKQLGKLLGVDSICSGTITDLVDSIKINARMISTESGSVFAVASVEVQKDAVVKKLLGSAVASPGAKAAPGGKAGALKANVTYFEDFSKTEEGTIPGTWLGGETLSVSKNSQKSGKLVLAPFKQGKHSFVIPDIEFPDDFKLEIEMENNKGCCGMMKFAIGGLNLGLNTNGDSHFDETSFRLPRGVLPVGEVVVLKVEKKGQLTKLYINGNELAMARKVAIRHDSPLSFSYGDDRYEKENNFGIYKISVSAL